MDAKNVHLRVTIAACLLLLCWLIFAEDFDIWRVPASKVPLAINGGKDVHGNFSAGFPVDQHRNGLENTKSTEIGNQWTQEGLETANSKTEARNKTFEQEFQAGHGRQQEVKEAWAVNGVGDKAVDKNSGLEEQASEAVNVSSGRVRPSHMPLGHAVPQRVENGDLRWTKEGEEIVLDELDRLAYPPSCRTAKILYVTGFCYGQGVAFSWWLKGLRLGMALDRTVIFGECGSTYDGCPGPLAGRFECYFQCPGSCSSADMVGRETVDTWDGLDVLERARALDHVAVVRVDQEKYESCIFPERLWQTLVERQAVHLEGGGDLSQAEPLAKLLMLSALQTLWLYRPQKQVLELVRMLREKNNLPISVPVIGIHIRRGDKKGEDPYFKKKQRYRPVQHYCEAWHTWLLDSGRSNVSHVFIMSDSDTAIKEIVSDSSGSGCNKGMAFVYNNLLTKRPEAGLSERRHVDFTYDEKREQVNNFYASLYLLFQSAEHVVVTSSSNVGLLLWQMMAAKYRYSQTGPHGAYVTDMNALGYDTSPRNLHDVVHPPWCMPRQ